MRAPIVHIDVDGVVADLHAEWLRLYNADYGDSLTVEEAFPQWDVSRTTKAGPAIFDYLKRPDLYDNVRPIPGARQGLGMLQRRGFRLFYLTSCNVPMTAAKLAWLERHDFLRYVEGIYPVVHTEGNKADKGLVSGDVLLDDHEPNLVAFGGAGVLMDASHNQSAGRYPRVKSWTDAVTVVSGLARQAMVEPEPLSDRRLPWAA